MIFIKKFIFSLLLVLSLITSTAYAEPKSKILTEGIYKSEFSKNTTARFRNISEIDMTVIVITPLKYLKLYTDLSIDAATSIKPIDTTDLIIVIGNGEVVMDYDF